MTHVGLVKVIDLARQRFYWPYIEMTFVSIYHNSVTVCNLQDCTPLVPTKSTYPFQIISFDYLHLDIKSMLLRTNSLKQQFTSYLIILYSNLAFQLEFIMTVVLNSTIICFDI